MKDLFTQKELILIGVSLVAGGASGTLIKIVWDAFQNRAQPVWYFLQFEKMFAGIIGGEMTAELKITDGKILKSFSNLFVGKVEIENKGNTNMAEFEFGMTLGGNDVAVFVETEKSDRHHSIRQIGKLSLDEQTREIDFICKPFNRNDKYVFRIFVSIPANKEVPREVQFSTAHPVKFVDLLVRHNRWRAVARAMPPGSGHGPDDIPRVIPPMSNDQGRKSLLTDSLESER